MQGRKNTTNILPNGTFDAVGSPTSRLWCHQRGDQGGSIRPSALSVSSSPSSTSGQVKITCRAPRGSLLSLTSEELTLAAGPSVHESRPGKHIPHLNSTISFSCRTSGGEAAKKEAACSPLIGLVLLMEAAGVHLDVTSLTASSARSGQEEEVKQRVDLLPSV